MIIEGLNKTIGDYLDPDFEQVNLGLNPNIKEIESLIPVYNEAAIYRGLIVAGNIANICLVSKILGPPGGEEHCFAAKFDNLNVVRYILGDYWDSEIANIVIKYDNSDVFTWALESRKEILQSSIDYVYIYDSINCFTLLHSKYSFALRRDDYRRALKYGSIKILQYLIHISPSESINQRLPNKAIVYGQLKLLKYLHSINYYWNLDWFPTDVVLCGDGPFRTESGGYHQMLKKGIIKYVRWAKYNGFILETNKIRKEIEEYAVKLRLGYGTEYARLLYQHKIELLETLESA